MNQGKAYQDLRPRGQPWRPVRFHQVEELVFGERSSVVIDASEERIKNEFEGEAQLPPLHSVLRIDEVKQARQSKITSLEGAMSRRSPFRCTPRPVRRRAKRPRSGAARVGGLGAAAAQRRHAHIMLRRRDGDAVLLEGAPDGAVHVRAHVVHAALRIRDPEAQLEVDAVDR